MPNGTLPLSGSGSANPNSVSAGSTSLLTVTVNPATNPVSTGVTVNGDLSAIGGPAKSRDAFVSGLIGCFAFLDIVQFPFSVYILVGSFHHF